MEIVGSIKSHHCEMWCTVSIPRTRGTCVRIPFGTLLYAWAVSMFTFPSTGTGIRLAGLSSRLLTEVYI
jgi:hypothetical protein